MRFKMAAALLGILAAPASAQVPQPPAPPSAEPFFQPGTIAVSLYGVGAAFTDFQRGTAQPIDGSVTFQRRLSASTTAGLAAELTGWLTPAWGVRIQGAWLPSRFNVKYDPEGAEYVRTLGTDEEPDWKRLHLWTVDVAALLRPPLHLGRVAPYGILGAGLASYRASAEGELPPEAGEAFAGLVRTSWAAVAGIGAVVPLQRDNLLLSFALTSHFMPTPLDDAGGGTVYEAGDLIIRIDDPQETGRDGVSLTSSVRLMVGLTRPLGRL